ncbi:MAG: hypothetical protein AAFR31_18590 [Cyanobacteria bacterium J06627_8]
MATLLVLLFVAGWIAVALIGTQAYFRGEQSKAIHERNWNSRSFDRLAENLTGNKADYSTREHAFGSMDAYQSQVVTNA